MWEITGNNLTTDHIWKWIGLICFSLFSLVHSFVPFDFARNEIVAAAKLRPTLSMTWSNWLSANYKLRIRNAKLDSELSFLFSLRARAYRVVKMRFFDDIGEDDGGGKDDDMKSRWQLASLSQRSTSGGYATNIEWSVWCCYWWSLITHSQCVFF